MNLKRTKFSEVNTPSNRFFELNFLSLLYVIMVKRKVFCHFFGLWVGPSRMRCRHFKSESCARKNFCLLFCSIFFSLVRYLYNASINDQEGEKRMGFFWLHEKPQDYKKWLVISLSYYFLCNSQLKTYFSIKGNFIMILYWYFDQRRKTQMILVCND